MIVPLLLAIVVFVEFYRAANISGKNGVLWGFIGAGYFLISITIFANTVVFILVSLNSDYINERGSIFQMAATAASIVFGWIVKNRALKRHLKGSEVSAVKTNAVTTTDGNAARSAYTVAQLDPAAESALKVLKPLGYTATYENDRLAITDPDGRITRYFSSSADLVAQIDFLVQRATLGNNPQTDA